MKTLITNLINPKSFAFLIIIFQFSGINCFSQLIVTPATTNPGATAFVGDVFIGTGVTFSNVTWKGQFTYPPITGGQIGSFTTGSNPTNLGISNGIIMSTGGAARASQPNIYPNSSKNYYDYFCYCEETNGDNKCLKNLSGCQVKDSDLEALLGVTGKTFDATSLEFDFVPNLNQVSFRYVFASDEYPHFVCSVTNDVFGFFVTGAKPGGGNYTNQIFTSIPGKDVPVAINTVNSGHCGPGYLFQSSRGVDTTNSKYYVDNTNGTSIVYNAFTTVFTAKIDVIPNTSYHIKLAIADVVDGVYDSSVFIEAKSFSSSSAGINQLSIDNERLSIYPNPCNQLSVVSYQLSGNNHVNISLYDITGRKVKEIINKNQSKGKHDIEIDTQQMEEGIYILKLSTKDFTANRKIVVKH